MKNSERAKKHDKQKDWKTQQISVGVSIRKEEGIELKFSNENDR